MDSTTAVAIAGIFGTVMAGALGPFIAEKMRRKSERDGRLLERRLDLYADMVRVAAKFADNVEIWGAAPLADLPDFDEDELNRIVSRIRVVGSDEMKAHVLDLMSCATDFYRPLVMEVRPHAEQLRKEGKADDTESIQQRMALADVATRAREVFRKIEATARADWR